MNIKKLLLLATALYASQYNRQLVAMSTLPAEVQNLIFALLPMRSILNFMQTAKCYAKLHESNMPTHCFGCTIDTRKEKIDVEGISKKIKNTSIVGLLTIKGCIKRIFNDLSNQTLITDLQLLDFAIIIPNIQYPITDLSKNTIKTLKVGKSLPDGERVYVDINAMTNLLKNMPYLEQCTLSHVALHCNDQHTCDKFMNLGTELFRTQKLEIHNSSIGYHGISWIQIALKESKTIEELMLNNIYTTQSRNFEEDNYTDPVSFTERGIGRGELLFDNAHLCPTMQRLTLNNETHEIKNHTAKKS